MKNVGTIAVRETFSVKNPLTDNSRPQNASISESGIPLPLDLDAGSSHTSDSPESPYHSEVAPARQMQIQITL